MFSVMILLWFCCFRPVVWVMQCQIKLLNNRMIFSHSCCFWEHRFWAWEEVAMLSWREEDWAPGGEGFLSDHVRTETAALPWVFSLRGPPCRFWTFQASTTAWTNFFFLFYYWNIIACVSFCCTMMWISHMYTYIPSLLDFPPNPSPNPHTIPLGRHGAPSRAPCAL